jgi:hypothetical protein
MEKLVPGEWPGGHVFTPEVRQNTHHFFHEHLTDGQ